ncbi:MAG: DUF349 domain-containing protein [Actinobacteria bacterium]|nr:DUF349 domain-containing protein [Actinomycetota bacterium]
MTIPTPGPRPVPSAPTPAAPAVAAPVAEQVPSTSFGRADADGTVWVTTADGDVKVGQYAAGTPDEGLAFFARKYDDLAVEATLVLTRMRDGRAPVESGAAVATKVREALVEPTMVGDLAGLAATCDDIDTEIEVQKRRKSEAKAAARAEAVAKRERLVVEAESLVGSTQWKPTGERFRQLLEDWKTLPHGDRSSEQALWKRFSAARSAFDKARRTHFSKLEAQRGEATVAKEALIAEAEKLSLSVEWGPTTSAYRALTDRWKAAPRGGRKDEDAWWARFRAAQDTFFEARNAVTAERDSEQQGNLAAKQALLAEAQALVPVTDLEAATKALRSIQQRWEAAGAVPRNDRDRLEGGLRKVEESLRAAEGDRWRRTDPAKRAFAENTVEKFEAALAKMQAQQAAAEAKGDAAAAAKAAESVAGMRELLAAAQRSLAEYS